MVRMGVGAGAGAGAGAERGWCALWMVEREGGKKGGG